MKITSLFHRTLSGHRHISRSTILLVAQLFCFSVFAFAQTKPQFSQPAGFYDQPLSLTLSAGANDVIYYTTDGSEPDENAAIYTNPLNLHDRSDDEPVLALISNISHNYSPWVPPTGPVQMAHVIRTRSRLGDNWSSTNTATYFIHPSGSERYNITVVSIVTDPDHLFDYDTGIYVLGRVYDEYKQANPGAVDGLGTPANYGMRGDDWERPTHMELFTADGERPLAMDIGVRIHGGGSRAFQQKSLRVYARGSYGESRIRYPIFSDQVRSSYRRLQLRNSGQDWMKTALRDGFMNTLVRHLPFESMAFHQALLFINGEFWGIANIRERFDKHYLSIMYDIPDDKIDYLTGNREVEEGSSSHYNAMMNYITQGGVADPLRYEYIQTQMDPVNFMYYNLSNIYFNNRDWPHNNIDFWRYQTAYNPEAGPGLDGRWRWMLFDTDFGFAWTDRHTESTYQSHVRQNLLATASRDGHWSSSLLNSLLKNDEFEANFINTYRDLMNTTFRAPRVLHVLDSLKTVIEPYVQEHIDRWGNSNHRWSMPHTVSEWDVNLNYMRRFAVEREENLDKHFIEKFNLGPIYAINVAVKQKSHGYLRINNTDLNAETPGVQNYESPSTMGLKYFEGHPVTITAIPKEGYHFSHWQHNMSDIPTIEVTGPGETYVAVFAPVLSITDQEEIPKTLQLLANYPNPFNPKTNISFSLPNLSIVLLEVYDILGQKITTLVDGPRLPGDHTVTFDATHLNSGIYIYRLTANGVTLSRKMSLVK